MFHHSVSIFYGTPPFCLICSILLNFDYLEFMFHLSVSIFYGTPPFCLVCSILLNLDYLEFMFHHLVSIFYGTPPFWFEIYIISIPLKHQKAFLKTARSKTSKMFDSRKLP